MGTGPDLTIGPQTGGYRYQYRPTDFSDWDGLHRLLTDCFAYMSERIDPPSSLDRMSPDDLRQKALQDGLVTVFRDDELIACGFLAEGEDSIYLGKLAVSQAFRRRGILKAIVTIAERLAVRRGKHWLELQTRIELTENHRAFEALGFIRARETAHPGYDRPTSVTMMKRVATRGARRPRIVPASRTRQS